MIRRRYFLHKAFSSAVILVFSVFFSSCLRWWIEYLDLTRYFCSVNESVWEFMKTVWWAALVAALIEIIFFHWTKNRSFIMSKIFSSIILIILIPLFFYIFSHFVSSGLYLNVVILIFAVVIAQIVEYLLLTKTHFYWSVYYASLFAFLMFSYLFMSFSVKAPDLILFK